AVIGQLKIPAAYFRGQWYVEAPPNCEDKLAQLRGLSQTADHGVASETHDTQESLTELIGWLRQRYEARKRMQSDLQPQRESRLSKTPPVGAPVPQAASNTQASQRPQPIDYGLTYDDLHLYDNVRAWQPEAEDDNRPRRLLTVEQIRASLQRTIAHSGMG